jgi:dTDP-4-amino-4,6-dideoxygalactose transaminase
VTAGTAVAVPFLDLASQHDEIRTELDDLWAEIITTNAFVGGRHVSQFEADFATYCGVTECVGVANGTDALRLVFAGLDIGPGDEVIVPANTFVATLEAIVAVGATPVFADVDPDTLLITEAQVEAAITADTTAVVVVHLYGQMPDMDAITRLADRAGIAVVEDAAQAHGASWSGRRAGSFGRAAAFSFYPGKNLGAFGDAGAVVTDDAILSSRIRALADHGRTPRGRHLHDVAGCNSRLDGLQAAILSIKLRRLDHWNERRQAAANLYRALLDGTACRPLRIASPASAVHHLEIVRVPERYRVLVALDTSRIGWGLHYPIPSHKQRPFAGFSRGPCPVTERAAGEVVSLPMFPAITEFQIERVCDALLAATKESAYGPPPRTARRSVELAGVARGR